MDPSVALIGMLESLLFISAAIYVGSRNLEEDKLPKVAILSAGIFVAQMLNFPVGGGTTGHLIGGALFAILAGPAVAVVGMTVVVMIQALLFGDGGVTAFGLNALNMAVIAPLTGWGIYALLDPVLTRAGPTGKSLAVGVAAWASVFVGACACAAELAVSYSVSGGEFGIAEWISIPSMLGYHAVIGVGEAAITVGVLHYLSRESWSMLSLPESPPTRKVSGWRRLISSRTTHGALSVLVVFALALPLYLLLSSEGMDGLEKTMDDAGVEAAEPALNSPLAYGETYFAALFAGMVGFVAVCLAVLGILKAIDARSDRR